VEKNATQKNKDMRSTPMLHRANTNIFTDSRPHVLETDQKVTSFLTSFHHRTAALYSVQSKTNSVNPL